MDCHDAIAHVQPRGDTRSLGLQARRRAHLYVRHSTDSTDSAYYIYSTPLLGPLTWSEATSTPAPKGGVLKAMPATPERLTTRTWGAEGGVQAGCRQRAGRGAPRG